MPALAIADQASVPAAKKASEVLEARAVLSHATTAFFKAHSVVAEKCHGAHVPADVAGYSAALIFDGCTAIKAFARAYKQSTAYQAELRGTDGIECPVLADEGIQMYLGEAAREVEACDALGIAGDDFASELRRFRDGGRPERIEDVLVACGATDQYLRAKLAKGSR